MSKKKPNLKKKPLKKKEEKVKIRNTIERKLVAAKEAAFSEAMVNLVLQKRVGTGIGDPEDFYDEVINGFKKTLSAKGIDMPKELQELIKDNGGRLIDKDNQPVLLNLTKKFGVVPKQE